MCVCVIRRIRNAQAVTVPLHKEIAFGTLRRILRDASISVDELVSVL